MFFGLPKEIRMYIYAFDPYYNNQFNKTIHQLKMRRLWTTSFRHRPKEKWIVRIPSNRYNIDDIVKKMIVFHKIFGPLKKRPYSRDDIVDYLFDKYYFQRFSIYHDLC